MSTLLGKLRTAGANVIVNGRAHKRVENLPLGCIGYADDLTDDEISGKHIDGATGLVYETDDDYLKARSPLTGFKPTQIEHQDALTNGRASLIANAALARGNERKG